MVEYDLGVPGSGKTYKGVYSLYSNFGLDEKLKDKRFVFDDVDFAYTNINELDLKAFKENTIKKLEFDVFYDDLTILHAMYKDKVTDTELIEKAKELNLFRCLIIIDECHNYLDKDNTVLNWWLSYHRHLHHQIYLITQNLALVFSKYKKFAEFFYEARPSSLKLFKNKMIYTQYISSRLSQRSKSAIVKIPFKNKIYETYKSGANQQSQNPLKKFVFLAIAFFIILILMFKFIAYYWSEDTETINEPNVTTQVNVIEAKNKNINHINNINTKQTTYIDMNSENLKMFKFECFNDKLCQYTFNDNSTIQIPYSFLTIFTEKIEKEYKYFITHKNKLTMYLLANEEIFMFLNKSKKGVQNNDKKEESTFNNLNPFNK